MLPGVHCTVSETRGCKWRVGGRAMRKRREKGHLAGLAVDVTQEEPLEDLLNGGVRGSHDCQYRGDASPSNEKISN